MGRWITTALIFALCGMAHVACAQTPAPTLERLSSETQALYEQVRPGIIRVHLPPTRWAQQQPSQSQGDPLDKW